MTDSTFYFSGWHGPNVYTGFARRADLTPAVLFSYWDMADRVEDMQTFRDDGVQLMMDSGAFSAWTKNSPIDRDAHTRFLERNAGLFHTMVALDVIGSPEQSHENYEWQRARVPVVPVYHLGEPLSLFDAYISTAPPVLGVGGIAGDKRRGDRTMMLLDEVFARVTAPGEVSRIPIHGFAMGLGHVLDAFPWGSVDSATAVRSASGGRLVLDLGDEPYTLTIRGDQMLVHDRNLTAAELAVVEERLAFHGYSVRDVIEFSVLLAAVNILEIKRSFARRIPAVYTPAPVAALW